MMLEPDRQMVAQLVTIKLRDFDLNGHGEREVES